VGLGHASKRRVAATIISRSAPIERFVVSLVGRLSRFGFDAACCCGRYPTGDAVFSSPAVANGVVYVGLVYSHSLYAFCLP
jgi:hypothetical protein